jgi:type II secretory pathway component PulK
MNHLGSAQAKAGSVLVLAMWTLLFLGALAVAVGAYVSSGLRLAEFMRSDIAGWCGAHAGVERAFCETLQDTNEWDALAEPWANDEKIFRDAALGESHYRVFWEDRSDAPDIKLRYGVRDEDGKINIRLAGTNLLTALFLVIGEQGDGAASQLSQAVVEYRNLPTVTGLTFPPASRYPQTENSASFRFMSVHELRFVRGMTEELFERILPFVTVYTGDGRTAQVNLNTAEPVVLQCVAVANGVVDPRPLVGLIMDYRRAGKALISRGRGMSDLWNELYEFDRGRSSLQGDFLSMGRGNVVTTRSSCFSGIAEGWGGGRSGSVVRVRFVVDRRSGVRRSWQEE